MTVRMKKFPGTEGMRTISQRVAQRAKKGEDLVVSRRNNAWISHLRVQSCTIKNDVQKLLKISTKPRYFTSAFFHQRI